jgi:hypothetical protein
MSVLMKSVIGEVEDERRSQNAKWGDVTEADRHMPIVGEPEPLDIASRDIAQCVVKYKSREGTLTWMDILKEEVYELAAEPDTDWPRQREEAIQVAAVAVALVEAGDLRASTQKAAQNPG